MQKFEDIKITTSRGRGFYDITSDIKSIVGNSAIDNGLFTAYIKHTSASLLINENYDPDVLVDMETFFSKLCIPIEINSSKLFIKTFLL